MPRVLLVEDNEMNRDMLSRRLARRDYEVLIAATSVVVLSRGVMPRWLALAGFVAAVFALLRFLIPLGGILGLLWVLAVSVLILAGSAGRGSGGPRRRVGRGA